MVMYLAVPCASQCINCAYSYLTVTASNFSGNNLILKKLKLPMITKDDQHCRLVSVKDGANKTKKIEDMCRTVCNLYFYCLMLWRDLTKVISVLN